MKDWMFFWQNNKKKRLVISWESRILRQADHSTMVRSEELTNWAPLMGKVVDQEVYMSFLFILCFSIKFVCKKLIIWCISTIVIYLLMCVPADRLVHCAVMELGQRQNPMRKSKTVCLWSPHRFLSRAIRSNESTQNSSHLFSELIIQSTTKKMFAVVQFVGGNFVEAVPLSWLRENEMMCLWPPHRFPNRATRSSEPPQDSWEAIAAKVLYRTGKRTFHQNECSFELAERERECLWTKWTDECRIREKGKLCRCRSQGDDWFVSTTPAKIDWKISNILIQRQKTTLWQEIAAGSVSGKRRWLPNSTLRAQKEWRYQNVVKGLLLTFNNVMWITPPIHISEIDRIHRVGKPTVLYSRLRQLQRPRRGLTRDWRRGHGKGLTGVWRGDWRRGHGKGLTGVWRGDWRRGNEGSRRRFDVAPIRWYLQGVDGFAARITSLPLNTGEDGQDISPI